MLLAALDVRGEGGYVLVPPSTNYRSKAADGATSAVAHAPERLLEMIRGKKEQGHEDGPGSPSQPVSIDVAGPPITEHGRNVALTAIAGRLHDGSRTLKELEEELERINQARCPQPLKRKEVAKIARSIHWRTPCRRARPEEIEQAVRAAEKRFWELVANELRGLGGQSVRDALRAIISGAARYGRLRPDGWIEYDESLFNTALAAGITRPTLDRARRFILERTGIRRAPRRTPKDAGAWVLPSGARDAEAQPFTTHATTRGGDLKNSGVRVVKGCALTTGRRRLADAETPCSRHFSPTNKGKGGVL
ncbi:MAG: primase C-terminal domain-containing protein, partial [Rubrobacteraceae bacterium]|nr:primase C-terminal domain-containing protein [Rubrobacteraceae bacterium]